MDELALVLVDLEKDDARCDEESNLISKNVDLIAHVIDHPKNAPVNTNPIQISNSNRQALVIRVSIARTDNAKSQPRRYGLIQPMRASADSSKDTADIMYAKAACITAHTLAVIFSIRHPRSSSTKEKADKVKDEGLFSKVMIDFLPRFGQSAAAAVAGLYIFLMSRGIIPEQLKTWQIATTAVGMFGFFLRMWSFRTLDRFFTFSLTIRPNHRLVQDGPYRLLLHPSYTALMLVGTTYLFSLANEGFWTKIIKPYMLIPVPGSVLVAIGIMTAISLAMYRVRGEEKMLEQHFGSEWKQHASQRWRFIPYVI
ncbi:hypothetical protein BGZ80_007855 [Entomortierella chlamydospora]|uniref:Protein-S-isoprenylcysteine O-methyltransferase n=1 Tax=Entomortierella chlamydospora TaxID=101097 RepID=A0A9P6T1A1_9FUNG|nr:hypothetical protein BGZ80_007855 [Entomortierella chlamydospora]